MERLTDRQRNFDGTASSPKSLVIEEGMRKGMPSAYCGAIVNKLADYEDAEEKGLLLRLPVAIGEICWGWEYPTRIDDEDGSEWIICDIKRAKVVPKKFNIFMLDKFGQGYFATKEEAEQALKQMGE